MIRQLWLCCALLVVPAVASAQAPGETIEYYGTDAIGSVRIVFAQDGTVKARQDYRPFGGQLNSAAQLSPERFGGNTTDDESQQAYFHARQLQDRTGRFSAVDPMFDGLFDPQKSNRYAYAHNNGLRFVDPGGEQDKSGPTSSGDWWKSCSNILNVNKHDQNCAPPTIEPLPINMGSDTLALNLRISQRLSSLYERVKTAIDRTLPGAVLVNRSTTSVFVKPEDSSKANAPSIEVKPGDAFFGLFDGFAEPCNHPNEVYKVVDFTSAIVTPSGDVDVFPAGSLFNIQQSIAGGWKDSKFQNAHHDWDQLYKASQQAGGCR